MAKKEAMAAAPRHSGLFEPVSGSAHPRHYLGLQGPSDFHLFFELVVCAGFGLESLVCQEPGYRLSNSAAKTKALFWVYGLVVYENAL